MCATRVARVIVISALVSPSRSGMTSLLAPGLADDTVQEDKTKERKARGKDIITERPEWNLKGSSSEKDQRICEGKLFDLVRVNALDSVTGGEQRFSIIG